MLFNSSSFIVIALELYEKTWIGNIPPCKRQQHLSLLDFRKKGNMEMLLHALSSFAFEKRKEKKLRPVRSCVRTCTPQKCITQNHISGFGVSDLHTYANIHIHIMLFSVHFVLSRIQINPSDHTRVVHLDHSHPS